jgi:hypothetical protein
MLTDMTYDFEPWRVAVALLGTWIVAFGVAGAAIVLLARLINTWRDMVR